MEKLTRKEVEQLCEKYHFEMDLDGITGDLPVGIKQRIEILKALYLGADILIMDEPTAVLTPQEIEGHFSDYERTEGQRCQYYFNYSQAVRSYGDYR